MRNASLSRRAPKAQLKSQNRLARAIYESLEPRLVLSATLTAVYTESNNPTLGLNAVLAFNQSTNGTLSPIGSYNTGGTGQTNILPSIGPSDSSFEVIPTPDGRFVVAVNMGSSSVSTFSVNDDGGLTLVGTFASGGVQPDSLAITGNKLYVTNRGDSAFNPGTGKLTLGTAKPNITGFQILGDGTLKPIAGSTVSFGLGTSPSHSLITPDGSLLFVDNFAVPTVTAADGNTMIPFQIKSNGQLVEGTPVRAPVTPPQILGATLNPTKKIIYAGLALDNGVATFTYTASGVITYAGETPITGVVPCWGAASADGKFLYTGNTASDTVTVLSLADPLHPVQIQDFALGGPTPPAGATTRAFQVQLSPDGHTLFAISSGNPAGANANGNQLHDLVVGANGKLSEPVGPAVLALNGVPGDALDMGIAVVVRPEKPVTNFTAVYTESNNPSPGLNAVLAFRQNTNGTLSPIGSYNTGGTGQTNILPSIGPSDSSFEVIPTPDGRFVVAVNMGSSSVSTFSVNDDGGLTLVGTFASGGVQPDSLAITGNKLYVTNRGDSAFNPGTGKLTLGTAKPNITGFQILGDGTLKPIAGSTVSFGLGTSPSHSLITPDGSLLFVDNFAVPTVTAADGNTMIPFQIKSNGQLVEGTPVRAPVTPPQILGATLNPTKKIIYAGLALGNGVAVFTYNAAGKITYVGETPITGVVPCWGAASADGKFFYTGNTASDTVTVLSLADPLHPVQIQDFALGGPTPPAGATTRAFQVQFSPDGHTLFAISSGNPAGANANGNQLHDLVVGANGKLSEPVGPAVLALNGVPGDALDMGIAVVVRAAPVAPAAKSKINVNTATARELYDIPGVTVAQAQKIIAGRLYKSPADLSRAGFNAQRIAEITSLVTF